MSEWKPGALLVNGKLVGPAEMQVDQTKDPAVYISSTPTEFEFKLGSVGVGELLRMLADEDALAPPPVDLTIGMAIDPRGPMPCLPVYENDEWVMRCGRHPCVEHVVRGAVLVPVTVHEKAHVDSIVLEVVVP